MIHVNTYNVAVPKRITFGKSNNLSAPDIIKMVKEGKQGKLAINQDEFGHVTTIELGGGDLKVFKSSLYGAPKFTYKTNKMPGLAGANILPGGADTFKQLLTVAKQN